MIALREFLPRLLPYLPACSEPLAEQALLDSAIEFCEKSQVLRETLPAIYTVADIASYQMDTSHSQLSVTRVLQVSIDELPLTGVLAEQFSPVVSPRRPSEFYSSHAEEYFTLMLSPIPDAEYEVLVTVAVRPLRTATLVPDELFNTWSEAIIAGAKARAMLTPGQPFSDAGHAAYAARVAERLTNTARVEGNFGRIRGSMRIRSRPFA